ncbi:MAG: ACT domain-containing protein [Desulforhopalus sp.]|nr:ACT domain-containing protein [Desulforhopalus sp.]
MSAIKQLEEILVNLQPVLQPGTYVFIQADPARPIEMSRIVALIREPEGLSLVVEEAVARAAGFSLALRCAWITLKVHSDLETVGLTAAFASALAGAGISCNVVAGLHHDHLFVPVHQAERAMSELQALQEGKKWSPSIASDAFPS